MQQTHQRPIRALLIIFALFLTVPGFSTTILSLTGDQGGIEDGDSSDWGAQSWKQTGSYTNVDIRANLERAVLGNPFGNGFAVLEEKAGSHAVEVDSTDFRFPKDPHLYTLFPGLTLGPGTYYLAIYGEGFWISDLTSPLIVSAPDVSQVTDTLFSTDNGLTFQDTNNGIWQEFQVTGTAVPASGVPEPATLLMAGGGVFLVAIAKISSRWKSV